MNCETVRELMPDYALGTLSEIEAAAVRKHLRGCATCRADAMKLDEGIALFSAVAHASEPPPELKGRVLSVLAEEWAETPAPKVRRSGLFHGWPAIAAALVILAGALTWGGVAQSSASRNGQDATSYRHFLAALGGKDVRVGSLISARPSLALEGSAILYDSDRGQSWALVLIRAPGLDQQLTVTLVGSDGRTIRLPFPIKLDEDGDGSGWLVTAVDLSSYSRVRLTAPDGSLIATATAVGHAHVTG